MLVSGIVVLAGLCGFFANAEDPTIRINLEEISIDNVDNAFTGAWSATVESAEPVNQITIKCPIKTDLPAEMRMKFKVKMGGSPLPDVDVLACDALNDETVGKGAVAAGNPFPDKCPIKKGEYVIANYYPEEKRMPQGLPDGKLEGVAELYMPGKKPVIVIHFGGTISHEKS